MSQMAGEVDSAGIGKGTELALQLRIGFSGFIHAWSCSHVGGGVADGAFAEGLLLDNDTQNTVRAGGRVDDFDAVDSADGLTDLRYSLTGRVIAGDGE